MNRHEDTPEKKKRRALKWVAALFTLAFLVWSYYAITNWRGHRAMAKLETELKSRGEPFYPWDAYPPKIPDGKNFYKQPAVVAEMEGTAGMDLGKIREGDLPGLSKLPDRTNSHKDEVADLTTWLDSAEVKPGMTQAEAAKRFLELISGYDERLDEVSGLIREFEFQGNQASTDAEAISLPTPGILLAQKLNGALTSRAQARFRAGDSEGGWHDLETLMIYREKIGEGTLVEKLVKSAVERANDELVWLGLKENLFSDTQLVALKDSMLARPDSARSWGETIVRERAWTLCTTRLVAENPQEYATLSGAGSFDWAALNNLTDWDDFKETVAQFRFRFRPHGRHLLDGVAFSHNLDDYIFSPMTANGGRFTAAMADRVEADLTQGFSLNEMVMSIYPRIIRHALEEFTLRQLLTTALALEQYHRKNSAYPADLAGLVPEFLPEVPEDPCSETREKIRFKLGPHGRPVLWSVGLNGTDEGGLRSGRRPMDSEDVVWKW